MDLLYDVVLVLHLVGWAIVLGGYVASLREPTLYRGTFHGALTALVTGLLMVGLAEGPLGWDLDHVKIAVKLVVALAVAVLTYLATARDVRAPAVRHGVGALVLANVVVAVVV
ncbi:hypothetical protein [Sanguibacter suaedae]|uniref:Uncharacterized protein n=1 Tax=Sanguibacter suaedae TaxID=2795737 RepID=A0A934I2S0_9MICO|nr:hypothetical protein [Sanguibacter suaedae]MBI9114138.1 hypothetical protein [Sanguibacter suaedae]